MWDSRFFTDLGKGCLLFALACFIMAFPLGLLALYIFGANSRPVCPGPVTPKEQLQPLGPATRDALQRWPQHVNPR